MATSIRELAVGDAGAVAEFNARLARAGVTFSFPTNPSGLMPRAAGVEAPCQTAYVLGDGQAVRGGYILKDELFFVPGARFSAGNYQLPLSEGIVDRRYALVGVHLIKDALARQRALYCLGMGSRARPLPQLLQRLGWTVSDVPFLFRIENAGNFAGEIRWLRQRRGVRLALDLARYSGALAAAVGLTRLQRRLLGTAASPDVAVSEVPELPDEIDQLFAAVGGQYGLLSDRRAAAMRGKLPSREAKLSRLLVHRSGRLAGWVVVSISRLENHTQFGNMSLGCIVDGLAAPSDVGLLSAVACQRLESARCDLLVSNQSHPAWIEALRRQGFFAGPSNFVLAMSPDLASRVPAGLMHFTRADGDGPINL
jgi:hypothetical protein